MSSRVSAWFSLTGHAAGHHGVVPWRVAVDLGVPESTLGAWVRRGRLARPPPGVLVVVGTPATWTQQVAIATVSGSGMASHRTAAALWALDGFQPRLIEVLTPHGRRRKRTGWTVHESRTRRPVDFDEVDGIACTSLVRTLLDLPWVAHPFVVAQALDHACRRRRGTLEAVARRHEELPRARRRADLMDRMLGERLGAGRFADSGFETRAVRLVRSVRMPDPVLQHTVRDGDFVAHLDLAWPDIRWCVECDSLAHHWGKRAHEWDRARRRHLRRLGWETVEVTYEQVTRQAAATAHELRELCDLRRSDLGLASPTATGRGEGRQARAAG